MATEKVKGIIKTYDESRKYGFIEEICDSKKVYFFHYSNIGKKFKIEPLKSEVLFIPSKNEKGLIALSIEELKVEITGSFSCEAIGERKLLVTNPERLAFLVQQQGKILSLLSELKAMGISSNFESNRITVDASELFLKKEPKVDKRKRSYKYVPEGYHNTGRYLIDNLQNVINLLNHDYFSTIKGAQGEKEARASLKSIMLEHTVLNNLRFEVKTDNIVYSAEIDNIVITEKGIFIIEIKNIGGRRSAINISHDGVWTFVDEKKGEHRSLKNPYKQSIDHKFALQKLLKDKGINCSKSIIPIIAIANNDVMIKIADNSYPTVMRVDMIGTYISNYLDSNSVCFTEEEIDSIKGILESNRLEQGKYEVLDYCEKISEISALIKKLYVYWIEAEQENEKTKQGVVELKVCKVNDNKSDVKPKKKDVDWWYRKNKAGQLELKSLTWDVYRYVIGENSIEMKYGAGMKIDNKRRERLNIPDREQVYMIIDEKVLSIYANGFAICKNAFYFINDKKKEGRIEWERYMACTIREGSKYLDIDGNRFCLGSKCSNVVMMLQELQMKICKAYNKI